MDDWGCMTMQVHQPTQYLPGPTLQHLSIDVLVALAIPAPIGWSELGRGHMI